MSQKPATTILYLRPEPAGPDARGRQPEYRLKLLLKRLLRTFGWRCVAIRAADSPAPEAAGERHVRNVNIVASAPRVSGVNGCGYESAESADAEEVPGITQSAKKTGPDGHENGGTRTPARVLRDGDLSEAGIKEAR
jgi:hypothetical protein